MRSTSTPSAAWDLGRQLRAEVGAADGAALQLILEARGLVEVRNVEREGPSMAWPTPSGLVLLDICTKEQEREDTPLVWYLAFALTATGASLLDWDDHERKINAFLAGWSGEPLADVAAAVT